MNTGQKGKHWQITTFTLIEHHNYVKEPFEILINNDNSRLKVEWWLGQLEECPETKKEHMHIHVKFVNDMRFNQVVKFCEDIGHPDAHLEKVKNMKDSVEYCTKERTRIAGPYYSQLAPKPKEPIQGARTDLTRICKEIKEGKPLTEIADENPELFVRNFRGFEALASYCQKAKERPRHFGICLYGPPGTGKTMLAKDIAIELFGENEHIYYKPCGMFWPNYTNERTVIWDDVSGDTGAGQAFKNNLDKTPCTVPCKFGNRFLMNEITIITSNTDPRDWFPESKLVDKLACLRRIYFWRVEHRLFDATTMTPTVERQQLIDEIVSAYRGGYYEDHIRCGKPGLDRFYPLFIN